MKNNLTKHKEWFINNGYGTVAFNGSKRAWIVSNNELATSLIDFLKENTDITIAELISHLENQILEEQKEPTSIFV